TGGERVDGDDEAGGTAFVQANPQSEEGMSVNVVNGSATVETENGVQTVESGQQSTIPISVDLRPSGEPREPIDVYLSNINIQPFLPTVRNPFTGNDNNNSSGDDGSVSINIPNNTNSGSTGNGSGEGSSTGINVIGSSTGDNSGNGSGSNTQNSSSTGSSTGNTTVDTSNPFENNPDLPGSVDEATGIFQPQQEEQVSFITQGNIIALSIAVIAAFLLISFIVSYTRRNK